MSDLFISYVQEDSELADELAQGLEHRGFSTWYYERDALVGDSWLTQVGQQIGRAQAVVLLISASSLDSPQVTTEIDWVREQRKPLIPVLVGITHEEVSARQEHWAVALGTIVKLPLPAEGVTDRFLDRLSKGLRNLKVEPTKEEPPPGEMDGRLADARALLRDRNTLARAEEILLSLQKEHPDSPKVHRYLGQLYNRSFRPEDAVASFERAVELEPGNALVQWELGLAYQGRGRSREAAESLQKAVGLGLDPQRQNRARTLLDRLGAGRDRA